MGSLTIVPPPLRDLNPRPVVVLALTWVVAFSLRTGFIGLGPVLPGLAADLQLSNTVASTLVAIPTLMMGLVAVPGGALSDRWGPARTVALGLAAVAVGGGLRALTDSWLPLLLTTVLFGTGIGLAQPALPRLMRGLFPRRLGLSTGIYASGMVSGSILAASLTLPVEEHFFPAAGWRGPLLVWSALAGVSLAVWVLMLRPWQWAGPVVAAVAVPADRELPNDEPRPPRRMAPAWSPWRDRYAWIVALLFAAQGVAYYLMIAWLPAVYRDLGLAAGANGTLFALFNAATLPAILGFPLLSDRLGSRRWPCLIAASLFTVGAVGYVLAPILFPLAWIWPMLAGAGVAALFALTLVLAADVAPAGAVGATAGMALGIGYAGSALGPVAAGAIRDVTGGFAAALATLPVLGGLMLLLAALVPSVDQTPERLDDDT